MYSPTNTPKDAMGRDIKTGMQNVKSDISDTIDNVKETVKDAASKNSNKVQKLFDSASDEFSQMTETVTKQVKTNPIQSSIIALAAGYLLGRLFRS